MQGLIVVVCGEGFQQEVALYLSHVPSGSGPSYLSNRKAPIYPFAKPESPNSPTNFQLGSAVLVTVLLREASLGLRC